MPRLQTGYVSRAIILSVGLSVCRQNNWTTKAVRIAKFGTDPHAVKVLDEFNFELTRKNIK